MERLREFFTFKRTMALIGIILIVIFAFLNFKPVAINFPFATVRMPLFYQIVVVGLIGFIGGYWFKSGR